MCWVFSQDGLAERGAFGLLLKLLGKDERLGEATTNRSPLRLLQAALAMAHNCPVPDLVKEPDLP